MDKKLDTLSLSCCMPDMVQYARPSALINGERSSAGRHIAAMWLYTSSLSAGCDLAGMTHGEKPDEGVAVASFSTVAGDSRIRVASCSQSDGEVLGLATATAATVQRLRGTRREYLFICVNLLGTTRSEVRSRAWEASSCAPTS